MNATLATTDQRVLNSWKEIAGYLGRGVRTVQRWESEFGLPVRRPRGKKRSAVVAISGDVDAWMHHLPLVMSGRVHDETPSSSTAIECSGSDLILESRRLRLELRQVRGELRGSIDQLKANLASLRES
jgi:hypothetical protein